MSHQDSFIQLAWSAIIFSYHILFSNSSIESIVQAFCSQSFKIAISFWFWIFSFKVSVILPFCSNISRITLFRSSNFPIASPSILPAASPSILPASFPALQPSSYPPRLSTCPDLFNFLFFVIFQYRHRYHLCSLLF